MSGDTLDPRPAVLVTSELVSSCSSRLVLPRPVTLLCHILFSQALLPSLLPLQDTDQTASQATQCTSLQGFPYTTRNKGSESEFQSLTLVSSKASTETVRPFTTATVTSYPPPPPPLRLPLFLITGDDPPHSPGFSDREILQPSPSPSSLLLVDCLCVYQSGPTEMKCHDLITQNPLFSLSCTLCNSHGDKGMIQAFHGRKYEKPACEKVKLLF